MKFIYLVQGQAKLIKSYFHLRSRHDVEALFLTYDEELNGALYFPNSTWAEGRNLLLEKAVEMKFAFDYLIFVDDDTEFYLGNWNDLESGLKSYRPEIAVPIFDRTVGKVLPYPMFQAQRFTYHDEQLMAFSKKVVEERIVLPYQTHFDSLHWWATCRVQQILIHNIYASKSLQFNFLRVSNLQHNRYEVKKNSDAAYKGIVLNWVQDTYSNRFKDINKSPLKIELFFRTIITNFRYTYFNGIVEIKYLNTFLRSLLTQPREVELDAIASLVKPSQNWTLYGFGEVGRYVHAYVSNHSGANFSSIVDRALSNQIDELTKIQILSPSSIKPDDSTRILVASFKFKKEISSFLIHNLGLKESQIYFIKPFTKTY